MQSFVGYIMNSGLSPEAISKKAGIEQERITSFIDGLSEPIMSEVRKISKVLKIPVDLLISNENTFEKINILFRQAAKGKKEEQKADKISYTVGNALTLLSGYKQESSIFDNLPSVQNTYNDARQLASFFRTKYCSGDFVRPLLDLPRIVNEELNIILYILELGNDTDGASAVINKIPFIFISPRFEPRMLFTLAHELAHILSHHSKDNDFAKIDQNITELGSSTIAEEAFANAFASEVLLPEEGVGLTIGSVRKHLGYNGPLNDIDIIYLSRIYGVSFDVAAKRCENINLLPPGGAISLSEKIKEQHGSAEKRAEQLEISERPYIVFPKVSHTLIESAISKINSGEISMGKASEILSISLSDLFKENAEAE